jgi:hypothetical protein
VAYLIRAAMLMVCMSVPGYLIAANFATFEPYLLPLRYVKASVEAVNERVVVGPYVDPADLANLKGRGISTVVSLLDPSVVYEKSLIEREASDAPQAGLRFVNLPIRTSEPLTSAVNQNSARRLEMLLSAQPQGKIYVHGFLSAPRDLVWLTNFRLRTRARSGAFGRNS